MLILAAQALVVVAALVTWELASGRLVAAVWVSDPASVGRRLVDWFADGFIYDHLEATLKTSALGLGLGVGLGVAGGLVISQLTNVGRVLDPFLSGFYSMPQITLLPLFVLWFGIDMRPKVALVTTMVVFPLYFNTLAGACAVDRDLVSAVRVMGASRLQVIRYAVAPSVSAYVAAGIAIAVPLALVGSLVGDMLVGSEGLGYVVISSSNAYDTTGMIAGGVIIMVLGLVSTWGIFLRGRLRGRVAQGAVT